MGEGEAQAKTPWHLTSGELDIVVIYLAAMITLGSDPFIRFKMAVKNGQRVWK